MKITTIIPLKAAITAIWSSIFLVGPTIADTNLPNGNSQAIFAGG